MIEQVVNVSQTTVVREAWARGQALAVHGWIYKLTDGLLRDLGMCVTAEAELAGCYGSALAEAAAEPFAALDRSRQLGFAQHEGLAGGPGK